MSQTMLAAVFEGIGKLAVRQMPVPEATAPDDVKLKVKAASICGSDIHILSVPPGQDGKPGTIMGHEFYGVVEAVGSGVTFFKPGDTVAVDPIVACGGCPDCRAGNPNLCLNAPCVGQQCHGGFAQYCVVPQRQLHMLSPSVPAQVAAQTEPLACVMNAMTKLNPTPNDRVMVFGAGAIGLIFTRLMRLYGVRDFAICETLAARREHARRCEAPWIIDPTGVDLAKELPKRWGRLADIVIDAVGAGVITEQALPLLRCAGRYLIFGQDNHAVSKIRPALVTRNELTVMGSYCTHNTFAPAIDMLRHPDLGLELLVSHRVELKDILKGIEAVRSKEASRVIVYPNGITDK